MSVDEELALDIVFAARYGDLQDLEDLVKPDPAHLLSNARDYNKNTPLHMAAANGHTDVVNYILEKLADRSDDFAPQNANKNTPLHWAALNGHIDVIRALCPKLSTTQLLLVNASNRTPSEEAEFRGTDECLECAGYIDGCTQEGNEEDLEEEEVDEEGPEEEIDGSNENIQVDNDTKKDTTTTLQKSEEALASLSISNSR